VERRRTAKPEVSRRGGSVKVPANERVHQKRVRGLGKKKVGTELEKDFDCLSSERRSYPKVFGGSGGKSHFRKKGRSSSGADLSEHFFPPWGVEGKEKKNVQQRKTGGGVLSTGKSDHNQEEGPSVMVADARGKAPKKKKQRNEDKEKKEMGQMAWAYL